MREDFLHYLWKYKKFDFLNLQTTKGETIQVIEIGVHNKERAGPDFFNAKLRIANQLWAGNVEIHLKSSDWYAHKHEQDARYDNVILHVVWEDNIEVFRKDNSIIPTLEIKKYTATEIVDKYHTLYKNSEQKWINCEREFSCFNTFQLSFWQERLFIERLEQKTEKIEEALKNYSNDWEYVLFQLLARNFGLNINGEGFYKMAKSIPFAIIQKNKDPFLLESLFYGQMGMLKETCDEPYFIQLKKSYNYLKYKYKLRIPKGAKENYFRLRPKNFPTIRLSQLAVLYAERDNLFSKLMETNSPNVIYKLLSVKTTEFWKSHYSFKKKSRVTVKRLTHRFIDLLIINTIVPLKFCFAKHSGKQIIDELTALMRGVSSEKNSIIRHFNELLENNLSNALESQAMLQLKKEFCDKNRCLHCNLGLQLLKETKS